MTEQLLDDGLDTPEIGPWGEEKYRLVHLFARLFATSMKEKWDYRVYIDLFAGSGRSRIEGTKRIIRASPLLALEIPDQFDRYIFCEQDEERMAALQRV
jgi:three-Cys-motif partner protein